ncbi:MULTISPECIES: restriction endonuclease subunit S [Enterobacter]|uniref:restriction endonuclease subunit S n=1 Tax=Enterobacter sp. TaxID=42895 RepID=UPI002906EAD6|nr:restriction endonuclease subunit S [Enterobacter sp.]MDU7449031.1 restriction endonuclease subunit S [Enterobacter sp.]
MSEVKLPEGWIDVQLGQIIDYGKANKKVLSDVMPSTWVLELEDIEKDSSKLLNQVQMSERPFKSTKNSFKKGDVLYGKLRPYLNKVILANSDGVCTTEIIPISAEPLCSNKYIFYWLKNSIFLRYVNAVSYGVNMPRLGTSDGNRAPFRLAPFAEQKIIADKLDTLLAQVGSTKARLEQIPQILKRFRQAVLVAAVSGNFTEEWRAQNPDQACTKIVSLGDIIIDGPQNGIYKPSSLYGSGHKIVRIDSFYDGVLCDWNTFKRVQLENSDVQKWSLRNNDILINRVNSIEYLGKCGLVENLPEVTVFESNIMRITLNPEKAVAKFVTIFLSSIIGLSRLRENAKLAVNQASINQKDVKSCKIELPNISEQTEIVRRVEQFFAYADTIEKQLQNALERVDNLTQSILAKAFHGELTAQWRAENPELISGENSAQSLLVKIQQQRKSINNIKHRKGKS